jgi:hypothetical protein
MGNNLIISGVGKTVGIPFCAGNLATDGLLGNPTNGPLLFWDLSSGASINNGEMTFPDDGGGARQWATSANNATYTGFFGSLGFGDSLDMSIVMKSTIEQTPTFRVNNAGATIFSPIVVATDEFADYNGTVSAGFLSTFGLEISTGVVVGEVGLTIKSICIARTPAGVEQLTNGDFETGLLTPWTVNTGTCTVAEEAPYSVFCSDDLGTTPTSNIRQTFAVTAGKRYKVSWTGSTPTSGGGDNNTAEFTIGGQTVVDNIYYTPTYAIKRSYVVLASESNALGLTIGSQTGQTMSVRLDNISCEEL